MGVLLATDFALKEIPYYFPFIVSNEQEAKRVVDQIVHKPSDEITNYFLDLFGMSDIVFNFISQFTELLQVDESINKDQKNLRNNKTPNKNIELSKKETVKKVNTVSRKQKAVKTDAGTTTSQMLLKRIQKLNQKEEIKKEKNFTKSKTPIVTETRENHSKSLRVSVLPEALQVFENIEMTEESIDAMSKYFQKLQVDQQLSSTHVTFDAKVCGCQSLVHGLYTLSPNCLKCGKIICNLEANQTAGERCVFCGSSLLTDEQINDYLNILKLDKMKIQLTLYEKELKELIEKKRKIYSEDKKSGTKKIHMNLQGGSFRGGYINKEILNNQVETILAEGKKKSLKVQDMLDMDNDIVTLRETIQSLEAVIELESKNTEEDGFLKDAKKRLDTLLNFQNTSEERTKIIDTAGDFDFGVSGDVKALFEGTAEERALKLKLKQRNLKLLKEQQLQKVGRGKSEFIFDIDSNGNVSVKQNDLDLSKNNKASTGVVIDEEDEELLKEINDLRDKIYDLKLKDFDISSKKIFDPKDPKNLLSKTRYVNTGTDNKISNDKQYNEYILREDQRQTVGLDMGSLEENIALFI
ncbi:hypothetical protein QEN19_003197 [Hanseniaspora menglaensis]